MAVAPRAPRLRPVIASMNQGARLALQFALDAVARREPVHVARTAAEREAVYRMRYAVYVDELRYPSPHADAVTRTLRTPADDDPHATIFYTGSPGNVTATLRVRAWAPGELPAAVHQLYSLEGFADIRTRALCEVGMLMARRDARGTARVLAATAGAIEHTVRSHRVEAMLASCIPSTLRAYLRLGLRPYGGRFFSAGGAFDIPLLGVVRDLDHARRCASPWYPTLRRLATAGELPNREVATLLDGMRASGVEVRPEAVRAAVERALRDLSPSFLTDLPEGARTRMLREAVLLDVHEGLELLDESIANRDVYVVLSGRLRRESPSGEHEALPAGAVFGERGFLLDALRAPARIVSEAPSRVLHLRHGALARLCARRPRDASALHAALARALARRAAREVA